MAVFRPSGFEATNPAKSWVLNSLKLLTGGVETNPLPDEDEEDEKQDEDNCHEVKDVEAGPMRNEVWPGCHTLAMTT